MPRERSKSGVEQVVPLSASAVDVVRRRIADVDATFGEGFVHLFPVGGQVAGEDRPATWSSRWVLELEQELRAVVDGEHGLELGPETPRWTIHSLRHTFATHAREDLGVARTVVSLVLGHTLPGPRATRVYDRAELLPERRAALARWADWLARLAPGAEAPAGKVVSISR